MSDNPAVYKPGDRVWCNSMNWIWWPGRVVDVKDTPVDYQKIVKKSNKNCIAIVYFEADSTYEHVISVKKIMPYNCADKMKFLEKGYSFYRNQLRGGQFAKKYNIDMKKFLKDGELAERETGGNDQIVKLLEENYETAHARSLSMKELFVSSKNKPNKRKLIAISKVQNETLRQSTSSNKDLLSNKTVKTARTSCSSNRVFGSNNTIASVENGQIVEDFNLLFLNNSKINNQSTLSETLAINISETPELKNVDEIELKYESTTVNDETQINFDKHLMLSNLNSTGVQKETKGEKCVEDSTTTIDDDGNKVDTMENDHLRIFKQDGPFIPDWVKEEKWDTLEGTRFNEAMQALKTDWGKLKDLSHIKRSALKPKMPSMNAMEEYIEDLEIEFEPNEPPPGYERRYIALIPPVDEEETEGILSDEELLKLPFFQKVLRKIELGETDGISVTIPNAVLLPKE